MPLQSDLTKLYSYPSKPRVFVTSDIENEPDDQESLVRYLLYANEFNTRGICAVTSAWLPDRTVPTTMRLIIDAYAKIVCNLNMHVHPSAQYPAAEVLYKLVTSGHPVYGKEALSMPPSHGALMLLDRLEESTEPLWILCWGGTNVIAETLQHIRKTKTTEVEAALHSRMRLYAISDQDDTGEYIRCNYPDVFFIVSLHAFGSFDSATWQGISHPNSRGDLSKVTSEWLKEHIQVGPLGQVYPTPMHIMEGDTPTFLYLIQNGLNAPESPSFGGWGGRYRPVNVGSVHYADVVDTIIDAVDLRPRTDGKASIARWRDHFQNDFKARMSWTLSPDFLSASHPPVPVVNGHRSYRPLAIKVKSNDAVVLDASDTYDPDHPTDNSRLEFQWFQYLEPTMNHPIGVLGVPRGKLRSLSLSGAPTGNLRHNAAGFENVALGARVEFTVPNSEEKIVMGYSPRIWLPRTGLGGFCYHIILQVHNKDAEFPVFRYMRVILDAGLS